MLLNLTDPQIKQLYKAVQEIEQAGGFGEITMVFRKGNVEYLNHTIVSRFNQPEKDLTKPQSKLS